jgi:anti-sigma B factor antagonist
VKSLDGRKPLEVMVGEKDGAALVAVRGEVDLSTSPDLRALILRTVAVASGTVAVDLHAVGYMDSSGVATLIEGLQASVRRKLRFVLLAPSKPVSNVLGLTRLDSIFDIRDSLEAPIRP